MVGKRRNATFVPDLKTRLWQLVVNSLKNEVLWIWQIKGRDIAALSAGLHRSTFSHPSSASRIDLKRQKWATNPSFWCLLAKKYWFPQVRNARWILLDDLQSEKTIIHWRVNQWCIRTACRPRVSRWRLPFLAWNQAWPHRVVQSQGWETAKDQRLYNWPSTIWICSQQKYGLAQHQVRKECKGVLWCI